MIQAFFSLGAFHVQFNTLSTETLLDAQAHPENYRDLLVRVAGYSTVCESVPFHAGCDHCTQCA